MDVVALNERLRGDFSAMLKQLPAPHAVSVLSTLKQSISSTSSLLPAAHSDLYTQHCRFMLWRLNSYQYGSASAFLLDLEQLERVSESPETKQKVKNLLDRLAVSEGEKQSEEGSVKVCNRSGTTVSLGSSSGVRGLQKVVSIGSAKGEAETDRTWLCNVMLNNQIVTIGSFKTKDEAFRGYEEQRKMMAENAAGFNKLKLLAAKMEAEQREEDKRMLKEAVALCHPRLTTMKVAPVTTPTSGLPVNNVALSTRGIPRFVAKGITAAASSPGASPVPSETGASPLRVSRASKRHKTESVSSATLSSKKPKAESARNAIVSSTSVDGRSYLKLRRLIQKRLCRHLKGKEVCVLSNPAELDNNKLRASGRLEAGKVFSFRRKKQMIFADYVRDELGRAESACAHMFLVRSKESIDDHLKVCDAFSEKKRESIGSRPQPARSKKALR